MPKKRRPSKLDRYVKEVFSYILTHPDVSLDQIQTHVNSYHGGSSHKIPSAASIIYRIRTIVGEEVLVCNRSTNLYRIATTKAEGYLWVQGRKENIRNQAYRTYVQLDNLVAKFGSDSELDMAKAALSATITILDASIHGGKGGTSASAV